MRYDFGNMTRSQLLPFSQTDLGEVGIEIVRTEEERKFFTLLAASLFSLRSIRHMLAKYKLLICSQYMAGCAKSLS